MSDYRISDRAYNFVVARIESVEQLEILKLLASEPDQAWTPEAVSLQLRSNPASVAKRLADLSLIGVLALNFQPNFSYRYAPTDPELRATVDELLSYYPRYKSRLIRVIYSKPSDKITIFADAFRFREKDDV